MGYRELRKALWQAPILSRHALSRQALPSRPAALAVWRGDVAQLGERLVCNQEVGGSSPLISTRFRFEPGA